MINRDVKEGATQKKLKIFEAGRELFFRYGIKRVTVEEICEKSEVSKMTFYRHYSNKMDLAKDICIELYQGAMKDYEDILARDLNIREKIEEILRYKKEISRKMNREFAQELIKAEPELAEIALKFQTKGIEIFAEFIKQGQQAGEIRKEVKPEFILAMADKLFEMTEDNALIEMYEDYSEFVLELNSFFFYGILERKNS